MARQARALKATCLFTQSPRRATFYPDEAHLSLLVNHSGEMLGALIALAAA